MVEKKEIPKRYVLTEVPIQMGNAIQDNEDGVSIPDHEILLEILNKLDRIEKALVG